MVDVDPQYRNSRLLIRNCALTKENDVSIAQTAASAQLPGSTPHHAFQSGKSSPGLKVTNRCIRRALKYSHLDRHLLEILPIFFGRPGWITSKTYHVNAKLFVGCIQWRVIVLCTYLIVTICIDWPTLLKSGRSTSTLINIALIARHAFVPRIRISMAANGRAWAGQT